MFTKKVLLPVVGFLVAFSGFAQTRLGLHYTKEELTIWKQRAASGPYKSKGDVQANSPGDWERIVKNANTFLANPNADRYKNYYTGGGCVPQNVNGGNDPGSTGPYLRDAAFYYLITGDTRYSSAVRTVLLAEANNSMLNFANTSRWCPGGMKDINPGFVIAEWLIRILYGYDYIKGTLSSSDRAKLDSWFLGAANYMKTNYDPDLEDIFVDRASGNYTIAQQWMREKEADASNGSLMYYGGPKARFVSRQYSNRRVSMAAFVGLAGVFLNNSSLKTSGKRFFKELMMFGIYPTGYYVDFTRSIKDKKPEQGYMYATMSGFYALADAFARTGDTELYDWTTKSGTTSSTSGADASSNGTTYKGLKMHVKAMLDLRNHTKTIYGTSDASQSKNPDYRMDGIDENSDNYSVWDVLYAVPNLYYKDTYIKSSYLRKASGSTAYPSSSQNWGSQPVWTVGYFPGVLFMYGQMDGKVWPYPNGTSQADNGGDPTPTPTPDPTPTPGPSGSLLREYWSNVTGASVDYIPVTKTPSGSNYITTFEGPTNWAENYGTRISGYVTAPTSGNYNFWISGNDDCELWLSTDDKPANKKRIAYIDGYTKVRQWDKYSSQKSADINLVAGKKYYIEALHKEGLNSDNITVGWELPNGTLERPIGGNRLSPPASSGRVATLDMAETAEPINNKMAVRVFPNPAEDVLTIALDEQTTGPVSVTVIDMLSKVYHQAVETVDSETSSLELNLANLAMSPGVYILKIQSGHRSEAVRIIKR